MLSGWLILGIWGLFQTQMKIKELISPTTDVVQGDTKSTVYNIILPQEMIGGFKNDPEDRH